MAKKYQVQVSGTKYHVVDANGILSSVFDNDQDARQNVTLMNDAYDMGVKKKNEISVEIIVGGLAILIAVLSLIYTIDQGIKTREHNEISVAPMLSLEQSFADNTTKIELWNHGLGTAHIVAFEILIDGKRVMNHIGQALTELAWENNWRHGFFHEGDNVPVNRSHTLLEINRTKFSPAQNKTIDDALRRISIRIRYQSPYRNIIWTEET